MFFFLFFSGGDKGRGAGLLGNPPTRSRKKRATVSVVILGYDTPPEMCRPSGVGVEEIKRKRSWLRLSLGQQELYALGTKKQPKNNDAEGNITVITPQKRKGWGKRSKGLGRGNFLPSRSFISPRLLHTATESSRFLTALPFLFPVSPHPLSFPLLISTRHSAPGRRLR